MSQRETLSHYMGPITHAGQFPHNLLKEARMSISRWSVLAGGAAAGGLTLEAITLQSWGFAVLAGLMVASTVITLIDIAKGGAHDR